MYWRVVHFVEENSVEAVPLTWIHNDGTMFYWPPFSGKMLKSAIAENASPSDDWKIHAIRIIGEIYDDLGKAKMKAIKAESTSDINSDIENEKRKSKPNRRIFESDTESSINSNDSVSSSEHDVILKPKLPQALQSQASGSSSMTNVGAIDGRTPSTVILDKTASISTPRSLVQEKHEHLNSSGTKGVTALPDEAFKKQVLRQFSILTYKIDKISEDMNRMFTAKEEIEDIFETILDKFNFPLGEIEDLLLVEDFLTNESDATKFAKELSRIGGITYKIMIKRIMGKLFSNKLAEAYSWIGFKGKNNFSTLAISSIVTRAVQLIHRNITNADIENGIKQWLVKSK